MEPLPLRRSLNHGIYGCVGEFGHNRRLHALEASANRWFRIDS
jgi:hypothetical protein